ncbi:MAG: GAF domain-containing protein [Hyphomicrobiales bacterium]|nr:GAF domain-containing protein [Hyphomicrobiales bacterium]
MEVLATDTPSSVQGNPKQPGAVTEVPETDPLMIDEDLVPQRLRPRYFIGFRLSALLETLAFLSFCLLLDFLFGEGNRFWSVSPHPFWIVVLLVAVQYGTKEAVVAALLSSAFLLVGNLPAQQLQTTYEYLLEISQRPILWLATSVVLGEMRVRQIRERNDLRNRLYTAERETYTITRAYQRLKEVKESLETRLAGEMRSAISIYEAAKALRSLDRGQIIHAVQDVIHATLNPQKFSLYVIEESGLRLATTQGWDESDHFVQFYPSDTPLYQRIVGEKKILCVVNENDERILTGQGIVAGPLIDGVSGEIFGMLKVEKMDFAALNMRTIETFRIVCEWIGMAYANAGKYQFAKQDSIINYDQMVFSHSFYRRQSDFLSALAKRVGFDLTVIFIRLTNAAELSERERNHCARLLGDAVRASLRKVDHIFNERRSESDFAILLPGTGEENAGVVVRKIKDGMLARKEELISTARYAFSIQVLHKVEGGGWEPNRQRWVESG